MIYNVNYYLSYNLKTFAEEQFYAHTFSCREIRVQRIWISSPGYSFQPVIVYYCYLAFLINKEKILIPFLNFFEKIY